MPYEKNINHIFNLLYHRQFCQSKPFYKTQISSIDLDKHCFLCLSVTKMWLNSHVANPLEAVTLTGNISCSHIKELLICWTTIYVSLKSAKLFSSYCGLTLRQGILTEIGNCRFPTSRTPHWYRKWRNCWSVILGNKLFVFISLKLLKVRSSNFSQACSIKVSFKLDNQNLVKWLP